MAKHYFVYMMTNAHHTVLYTGMTGDIIRRGWQHKQRQKKSFTKRYNVTKMVYAEECATADDAIAREKQIKRWTRKKKDALINRVNPEWRDLYDDSFK